MKEYQVNNVEEEGIDIMKYVFLFLRNWYWILLGLLIGGGIAWLQVRYATTIYQVSGKVLIAEEESRSISEEVIIQDLGFSQSSNVSNEIRVLGSSSLMREVVDSLQLYIRYYSEGRIKTSEAYDNSPIKLTLINTDNIEDYYGQNLTINVKNAKGFALVINDKDSLSYSFGETFYIGELGYQIIKNGNTRLESLYKIKIADPNQISRDYASKLRMEEVKYTQVVNVSIKDALPQRSKDIISTLIHFYNKNKIAEKNSSGQKTLSFIDERLDFISRELFDVEKEVEEFRNSRQLSVGIGERATIYLEQLNQAKEELSAIELEESNIQRIELQLDHSSDNFTPLPLISGVFEGELLALVNKFNLLIRDKEQMLQTATEDNPLVATFDEQLSYIKKDLWNSLENAKANLEKRKEIIESKLKPIEQQVNAIPSYERQFLQIMREQQIKNQIFLYLFQKREETAISIAARVATSRLIDTPINEGPVAPNTKSIYLVGIFLGLGIPIGFLLLKDFLDNKVYDKKDVEKMISVPFLGEIYEAFSNSPIVVHKDSRSAVAESFRTLRTNLNFFQTEQKKSNITLITSSISGEGKTFVTINLGISMALTGKKTILLGFDLRKPKLDGYLSDKKSPRGLSNYLIGDASLDELILSIEGYENLYYIPSGPIPPNPAELILADRARVLIETLQERYDHIIIDTAPVGLVADAILLSSYADQAVVVIRHAFTLKNLLPPLQELYTSKKLSNMSVLLNGVKRGRGYGYGYGYGGGYYDETDSIK